MGAEPGAVGIIEQPLAQLAANVRARLDAFVGILSQHPVDERGQAFGQIAPPDSQSDGLLEQMADQPFGECAPLKGRLAAEDVIKGAAQAVDVGPRVGMFGVERLLRG